MFLTYRNNNTQILLTHKLLSNKFRNNLSNKNASICVSNLPLCHIYRLRHRNGTRSPLNCCAQYSNNVHFARQLQFVWQNQIDHFIFIKPRKRMQFSLRHSQYYRHSGISHRSRAATKTLRSCGLDTDGLCTSSSQCKWRTSIARLASYKFTSMANRVVELRLRQVQASVWAAHGTCIV